VGLRYACGTVTLGGGHVYCEQVFTCLGLRNTSLTKTPIAAVRFGSRDYRVPVTGVALDPKYRFGMLMPGSTSVSSLNRFFTSSGRCFSSTRQVQGRGIFSSSDIPCVFSRAHAPEFVTRSHFRLRSSMCFDEVQPGVEPVIPVTDSCLSNPYRFFNLR
jgi:hypothetical protein